MTPVELQSPPLSLRHSFKRINSYSSEISFYKGTIDKLIQVNLPNFVLFARLSNEGPNGEELEFEYITVAYNENGCELNIPEEATHFFLITEPPVSSGTAKLLQQRFSAANTNFPLKYPVADPFQPPS